MKALLNWLDDRTGIRGFLHEALYENIPGGSRWRYVWGSTLVFTFSVQVITGLFLWMAYSASAQTAWESVYYIQHQMQGGWLLRGLHHFTAQAMVVLLVLHLMQVVIDGAYRAPREVNFWIGLVLMQIVLALSLTGYLLPWDQKGYWATRVATNLMGLVPLVGDQLQRLVVGGSDYGHHTLTRFFALHAGLLPALLVFFLMLHVYLFRRHSICCRLPAKGPDQTFWPEQALKDAVACLAVLAVVLFFVVRSGFTSDYQFSPRHAGAELTAPADPVHQYDAARPEWYFLFLFQMLKYFPSEAEFVGAIVVPGLVMLLLFLMPLVGRWKLGHRFNIALLFALIFGGVVPLTVLAWHADHRGPDSDDYLKAVALAEEDAQRAVELAEAPAGIPPSGAISLMRTDTKTEGRHLFKLYCAGCHKLPEKDADGKPMKLLLDGAADLTNFATRQWLAGLLDPKRIVGPEYFGNTAHHEGDMVGFVTGDLQKWSKNEVESVVMALSAEAKLPSQTQIDQRNAARIEEGKKLIADTERCAGCHKFHDAGESGTAPDLTGYGSRQWLIDMVSNPQHERFYGENNDRMPSFAEHSDESSNILRASTLRMIVDWLRHDWYEPATSESEAGK